MEETIISQKPTFIDLTLDSEGELSESDLSICDSVSSRIEMDDLSVDEGDQSKSSSIEYRN